MHRNDVDGEVKRLCECCSPWARCVTAGPANALPAQPQPAGPPHARCPSLAQAPRPRPRCPRRCSSFGVPRPGRAPSPSRRCVTRPRSKGRGTASLPRPRPGSAGSTIFPGRHSPPAPEDAPYRVGSMVLAGAVTAGPRLPQPHGPPSPATRGSPRTERAQGRSQLEALAPPGSPGGTARPRPAPWQRGRSPGRRLGQDTVSRRAGPAERAGPAGTRS